MNVFKCDICNKETNINPPTEKLYKKYDSGEFEYDKAGNKIPVMTVYRQENPQTGQMMEIPIHATMDLIPRAYLVQLRAGSDKVKRDFCHECLTKEILPLMKPVWDKLESLKGN